MAAILKNVDFDLFRTLLPRVTPANLFSFVNTYKMRPRNIICQISPRTFFLSILWKMDKRLLVVHFNMSVMNGNERSALAYRVRVCRQLRKNKILGKSLSILRENVKFLAGKYHDLDRNIIVG